ncbi:MAG: hypothetical protein Q9218_007602 [Villophora microphyllina]
MWSKLHPIVFLTTSTVVASLPPKPPSPPPSHNLISTRPPNLTSHTTKTLTDWPPVVHTILIPSTDYTTINLTINNYGYFPIPLSESLTVAAALSTISSDLLQKPITENIWDIRFSIGDLRVTFMDPRPLLVPKIPITPQQAAAVLRVVREWTLESGPREILAANIQREGLWLGFIYLRIGDHPPLRVKGAE